MRSLTIIIIVFSFLTGCGQQKTSEHNHSAADSQLKESLIKANQKVVSKEDEQIENLLGRYGWKMEETGTGLRYLIYQHGNGSKAQKGQRATLNFTVRLISGDVVYSSDKEGQKQFTIGSGGVESGLEEAILLLHVGDKAKLIIPSHLAFGLLGDNNRIPPKSTLIYDVELVSVK